MGTPKTNKSNHNDLPPICRAIISEHDTVERINTGYRAFDHSAKRIVVNGHERWRGANERTDVGGTLTEAECWEYAFEAHERFHAVIRKHARAAAPWRWRGHPPHALQEKIDAVIQKAGADPWKAVDQLFDELFLAGDGRFGLVHRPPCREALGASAGYRQRCGGVSTGTWMIGGLMMALQKHYPEIRVDFLRVAFHPQNPIPTFFNHLAVEVTIGETHKIFDPTYGDMAMERFYTSRNIAFLRMTRRQAFVTHLCDIARMHLNERRFDQAIAIAKGAQRIDPTNPEGFALHGEALEKRDGASSYLRALALVGKAWDMNRENIRYHRLLGKMALKYPSPKQINLAKHMFRRILELDPRDSDAHFGMGLVMMHNARYDAAATCFATALEINPTFQHAQILLDEARRKLAE